jgi:uncharacterized protein (DUF1015 family)
MAEVIPFAGLLYEPEVALGQAGAEASSLLAPPYDVISEAGRKELAGESPFQSVHLILPQPPQGQASDARYAAARATLVAWQKAGVMSRDERPSFYRYHQVFAAPGDTSGDKIVRKGFVARIRLHRFSEGVILPHERTLSGPKADRLKLKRATRTHLSQVFGLYDDPERKADAAFAALEAQPPALHGTTQDGVSHKLWKLFDEAAIEQVQQVLRDKRIYIADGHHRYETMLALREELRQEPDYCGLDSSVEYGSIFLCNVRDPGLFVFPTHRVLHSLPEFSLLDLLAKLAPFFRIEEVPEPTAAQGKEALRTRGEQAMLFASVGRAGVLSVAFADGGFVCVARSQGVAQLGCDGAARAHFGAGASHRPGRAGGANVLAVRQRQRTSAGCVERKGRAGGVCDESNAGRSSDGRVGSGRSDAAKVYVLLSENCVRSGSESACACGKREAGKKVVATTQNQQTRKQRSREGGHSLGTGRTFLRRDVARTAQAVAAGVRLSVQHRSAAPR